ncbi:hypothetical protein FNF27_07433 [Cafeteria roenbergensis]|uniref:Xaa-Pro dipeptidyl-peptidase-like domain-containing protein n=1 Tax=Cafeteria roenbergensis TaxID=33653 RepID=A0A5A8DT53_CAFRO|nr:hypothetical protein FNF27_07433 [Cafeteria roenbergensis]
MEPRQVWSGMIPSADDGVELDSFVVGPPAGRGDPAQPIFVLAHPYGKMGGSRDLMIGTAVRLAQRGVTSVVFDMRGVGRSTGWSTLTHVSEVQDARGICRWLRVNAADAAGAGEGDVVDASASAALDGVVCRRDEEGRPLLAVLGSSAGSCVVGSAMDEPGVVAGVFSGYVFGWWASILFGSHFAAVKAAPQPKCFVQGSDDGFTTPDQLRQVARECAGTAELVFVDGVGHFELESPAWNDRVADVAIDFVRRSLDGKGGDGSEGSAAGDEDESDADGSGDEADEEEGEAEGPAAA